MTTITPRFPQHLLHASDIDRLSYFVEDVIVDHPILEQCIESLDEKANRLLEKRLLLLLGGAGVGKSALMKKLVKRRLTRMAETIAKNAQLIPALYYEVEAPDQGSFLFASLYRGVLTEVNSALIERTLPIVERPAREKLVLSIGIEEAGRKIKDSALKWSPESRQ